MSARTIRCLLMFALSVVHVYTSAAQSPAAQQARLAIEFPSFDGPLSYYVTAPEAASPGSSPCTNFSYHRNIKRLVNAGAGVEQPSALLWEICTKGDTVLVTPTVYFGDYDHQNPPASLDKLRSRTLATRTGKLNDAVAFPEMEQVGLEPLTLRIVTAQSDIPYHPIARSNVPSVQIEYAPVDRTVGNLNMRNLSNKAVDAFRIGTSDEETGSGGVMQVLKGGLSAVIAPESSYVQQLGVPNSGKTVDGTFVVDPQPQYVTLQAVLFADGSYEGDDRYAAEMAAAEFGIRLQHLRIERLADPILADDGLDDESKLEQIRAAIQQLSANPDSETVAQYYAQYPAFSEDALRKAESNIGMAMKSEIESMDYLIQENEQILQQDRSHFTLAKRWKAMTEDH
jgi:hypothetical protein